jgi:hypothetical protein
MTRRLVWGALWLSLYVTGCGAGEPPTSAAADARAEAGAAQALPRVPYRNLTREQIVLLLSESDVDAVATRISAMAQDSHNEIVCGALRSIWMNPGSGEFPLSHETASATRVRVALAATLAQCQGGSRPEYYRFVQEALKNSADELDRASAALALGIVGTDQDVPSLLGLATNDSSPLVASNAVAGLGILRTERARQALTQVTRNQALDPDIRNLAQRYLERQR